MHGPGEWERFCALLDDDASVWESVRGALESAGDAWEALLDGLDDAGALAYLRADDSGMELADALAQLPRVHAVRVDLDPVADVDDLDAAMRAADRVLGPAGLRVLRLPEEGDPASWPVVAVAAVDVPALAALADGLGRPVAAIG